MASPQASFPEKPQLSFRGPIVPKSRRFFPGSSAWLAEHGYRVIIDQETANIRRRTGGRAAGADGVAGRSIWWSCWAEMERCSRLPRVTAAIDVPLLGVNLGSLGFLTEVPLQSLYPMLEAIAQGRAAVEHRSLMQCQLLRGDRRFAAAIWFSTTRW